MEFAVFISFFIPGGPFSGKKSSLIPFRPLFSDIPVLFYPICFYYK